MNLRNILEGVDIDEELIDYIDIFNDLEYYAKIYNINYDSKGAYSWLNIIFKLKEDEYADVSSLDILIPQDETEEYVVYYILNDRLSNECMLDHENQEMYKVYRNLNFLFDRRTKNINSFILQQSLTNMMDNSTIIMHNQDRFSAFILKDGEKRSYSDKWMNEFFDKNELAVAKLIEDKNLREIILGEQNFINLIKDTELFNDFDFYDETPLTRILH